MSCRWRSLVGGSNRASALWQGTESKTSQGVVLAALLHAAVPEGGAQKILPTFQWRFSQVSENHLYPNRAQHQKCKKA